ncbi:PH domain-containing protein [Sphingosinicella sp. BN140058]|uniref:PH domain-containing protein n=1 Tax=Sphingosinicella sp. BN140058 TaxID=1892855 RepID=UPI0013ED4867|nr:PH domain-containing protein [Sphingosinicella sp. BN140058]
MIPLERGQLLVMRVRAFALALAVFAAAAVGEALLHEKGVVPRGAITLPVLVPLLWLVAISPARRFRAWGYQRTQDELHVRHGILTEIETVVPLDRVQHIDIAQGPLERACRVSRLVLHTAGTANSQVVVPGLSREAAESMRDDIRARIRQEAW